MNHETLKEKALKADKALINGDIVTVEVVGEEILPFNRSAGLAYLGVAALRKEDYKKAEKLLLESYQLNNNQTLALVNLIPVYLKLKEYEKAVTYGEKAYKQQKNSVSVAINYSAALLQEQRAKEALEILLPLYNEDNPNNLVLSGIISCYRGLFDRTNAEKYLQIAEDIFGDNHDVIRLRADTLAETDPKAALPAFKAAIEKKPDNVPSKWNMSLVQLRLEHFEEGWVNYDNGLRKEVGKIGRPLPLLFEGVQRILDIKELDKSKWTIVVAEQGIGDQILFLGCFNEYLADYPKTILICEKRLHSLLRRSFPGLSLYPYGLGQMLPSLGDLINGLLPIGSIQKSYRSSVENFERGKSTYLKPDLQLVDKYRDQLRKHAGTRKIIGFSWKGGFWERAQRTKTLDIEHWNAIFEQTDALFVSLQYGDIQKEREFTASRYENIKWIDGIDFKKDIDKWFALICACDDIVSVSTALVHFAGAAGKHVHLLLSDKGNPFIWGLERTSSIAYKNIDIYRKKPDESMSEYFNNVQIKLSKNNETV